MNLPSLGTLHPRPALEHVDLLAPSVAAALSSWERGTSVSVVEIDPELAAKHGIEDGGWMTISSPRATMLSRSARSPSSSTWSRSRLPNASSVRWAS